MKRGDVVTVATQGDYGKPRPALVIQSDRLAEADSILLCLITSDVEPLSVNRRIMVEPTAMNGLRLPSQIMVEKIISVRRSKCREIIGRIDGTTIERLDGALAYVVGLIDRQ